MDDFHPDVHRAARIVPRSLRAQYSLPVVRAMTRLLLGRKTPPDVEVLTLSSGVGVRLHRPPGATTPGPALLWIHGGGYLIGNAAQDDVLCRRFANAAGITVASVDYRLAPEFPFPAPVEDCHAALAWLAGLPAVDPARVAIGGASAGGGLAASLGLMARDRGEVEVASQLLVYPMLDDRSATRPAIDVTGHRLWSQDDNAYGWQCFLGDADPQVAVPARRGDLAGLPPAWIGVGTLDLFHDEDIAYAERLREAGVPCDVEVVRGVFHGFDGIVSKTGVAQDFFTKQLDFLRRTLTEREPAPA